MIAAGLASLLTGSAQTYFTGWTGERILADLRNDLFRHLQRLSLGYYERNRAGVVISRLTNDVDALDQLVTEGVTTLVQSTLTLIGTAIILFFLDWKLALATVTVDPAARDRDARSSARARRARTRQVRERLGLVTATLAEDIAGMRVVQAFTRERRNQRHFQRSQRALPRGEPADRRAERPLLPLRRLPLGGGDRDRARLRRLPRLRRRDDAGHAVRVHRSTSRTSSTRSSSSRSSTTRSSPRSRRSTRSPACSTRSRRCATARTRASCRAIDGHVRFEGVRFGYGCGPRGAARDRPRRARRDDGRARRPHRRRQVDDREAARALLRAPRRADHDRRRSTCAR